MCKNIKKEDFIKILNSKIGLSLNFSKKITDDYVKILYENIKSGNFSLKNVGTFKIVKKKQRMGRNPKTKQEFLITARKVIRFIPSNKLKINNNKFL